jgi:hypothetical protein
MLQMRLIMTFATGAISLASCGYPLPEAVEIFVNTFPPDASCVVSRGGQTANVDVTLGIALVPNEEADYLVACRRNGYQEAAAVVLQDCLERCRSPSVDFGAHAASPLSLGGTSTGPRRAAISRSTNSLMALLLDEPATSARARVWC